MVVKGCGGRFKVEGAELFLGNAGTAMRPLTAAVAAAGRGRCAALAHQSSRCRSYACCQHNAGATAVAQRLVHRRRCACSAAPVRQRAVCCMQMSDTAHPAACQILDQCTAHDHMPLRSTGSFWMVWPACASAPLRTWSMAWCSWEWMPSAPWAPAAPRWRSTPRACPPARWGQQQACPLHANHEHVALCLAAARSCTVSSLAVGQGLSTSVAGKCAAVLCVLCLSCAVLC
jgi:hypothetical protein